MKAGKGVALKKPVQLPAALPPCQAEMEVEDVDSALPSARRQGDVEGGMKDAPALSPRDGEVDILPLVNRIAAEDAVPVRAPSSDSHILAVEGMAETGLPGKHVDLPVTSGTTGPIVHLLQQSNIRGVMLDNFGDSFRTVAPVDAADTFVNIVAENPESTCRRQPRNLAAPLPLHSLSGSHCPTLNSNVCPGTVYRK